MAVISIALIADDVLTRSALTLLLSKPYDISVITQAPDFDCLHDAPLQPQDIILIAMCDDEDSLRMTQRVVASQRPPWIIVLLNKLDERLVKELSQKNVKGVLLRSEIDLSIADSVREVAAGSSVISRSVAEVTIMAAPHISFEAARIMPQKINANLSVNISETLYLFCVLGMDRHETAEALHISPNTVSSRVRQGYELLGVNNKHDAFLMMTRSERGAGTLER